MKEMINLLNKNITLNKFIIINFENVRNELLRIDKEERNLYEYEKKDLEFYNKSINELSYEINIYLSIINYLRGK